MSEQKIKQCSQALLLFIKNPVKGKVKTRLAASIGDERALDIYKLLLAHTRQVALGLNTTKRHLFYDQWIEMEDDWSKTDFQKHLQYSGGLGKRMAKAFEHVFEQGAEKLVIIGSDCAQLQSSDVEEAFLALDQADVVFGPAMDGGYYLCGMRVNEPAVFELKAWSTATVLEESIALCRDNGLSVRLLKSLSDIDTIEDWEKHGLR